MPIRDFMLEETNYGRLLKRRPKVALLPWGATEAHNYHMPYATDTIEASALAERGAALASEQGAEVIVLPTIPFGNDQQQLDQVCTISIQSATAAALLRDVVGSLLAQSIDRLVILNCHGGNNFQPIVRDIESEQPILIVVANFWHMAPAAHEELFEIEGDHADEMETSLLLHLRPDLVEMDKAGPGEKRPFDIDALHAPGVWTPRPWSTCHPDTGSGDPSKATAEKGEAFLEALTKAMANLLVGLSKATKGDSPYLQ